jgi:hypothetical protein
MIFKIIEIFVLKKSWISRTFCPFWSQFWNKKCKQKRLGTKISIEIFVKIHYFSDEIEKKIKKSTKITSNHKNLVKSQSWSRSTGLDMTIEMKSRNLDLDRDFLIVETRLSRPALCQCRDRDKSRPPGLVGPLIFWRTWLDPLIKYLHIGQMHQYKNLPF